MANEAFNIVLTYLTHVSQIQAKRFIGLSIATIHPEEAIINISLIAFSYVSY